MKPCNIGALAIIVVLFSASAAGFGYMPGKTSATLQPGEEYTFTWYVFGDPPFTVANLSTPAEWYATTPDRITHETPYRYRQTADGYQRLYTFKMYAVVPDDANPGRYPITAWLTDPVQRDAGTITVQHRQPFTATVTVHGTPVVPDTDSSTASAPSTADDTVQSPGSPQSPSYATEDVPIPAWLIVLLIFEAVFIVAIIRLKR